MSVQTGGRILICWLLGLVLLSQSAFADPVSDYNVAIEFYKQQRWQLAADACEEFLKKYPQHERAPSTRLYWAQALLHQKKYAEARGQFEQFLTQAPDHPDRPLAMYRVGECSTFLGDDLAAEAHFTQFLKAHSGHDLAEWARLYLGEAQFRLKRYEAAAKTFEESLAKHPEGRLKDDVEFDLAGVYDALQQPDKAEKMLKQIADRGTSTRAGEALFQLGAKEFDEQKFAPAAAFFQRLATEHPQHRLAANAQLNAGYAFYSLGQHTEAIAAFSQAAKDPQFAPIARFWTGLGQKSLQQYSEAANTFSELLKDVPEFESADKVTFHLADSEFRQGNYEKSIELFKQTAATFPKSEFADDALHAASEAALQSRQLDMAIGLHDEFVKQFPDSPLRPVEDLLAARVLIAKLNADPAQAQAEELSGKVQGLIRPLIEQTASPRMQVVARVQLARLFELRNEPEQVLDVLKEANSQSADDDSPELQDARLLRGNARLRLKQGEAAAEEFSQFLDRAKTGAERITGLTGLARGLIQQSQWPETLTTLKEIQKLDPEETQFSRIAVAAGDAAFDQQRWPEAQSFFKPVVELGMAGAFYLPALSGVSHAQYENKQFADAAQGFQRLSTEATADPILASHAAYMHALALQQAGEKEAALAAYQAGADQFSRRSAALPLKEVDAQVGLNAFRCEQGAARLARDSGNRELGNQMYQMAYDELKIQPAESSAGLAELINEWANMAYAAEDYTRSDELFAKLVAEVPDSPLVPEARLILAESARFGGDTAKAMAAFRELAGQPQVDAFVRQRSLVHLLDLTTESGNWEQALSLAQQLQSEFPGGPHAFYAAYREGEANLKLKAYDKAIVVLEKAKTTLPADLAQAPVWWPELWLMLAECHYWLKDYDKLDLVLADLRTKNPSDSVLYRIDALQGRGLENRARFDDARAAYRRAIDSEAGRGTETAAEAQFRIAESYLKENNLPVALREYYKVYAGYAVPRLSAAALFQAASCDVSMKHYQEAVVTYQKLLAEYPDSEFTEQAQARLKELQAALGRGT